mgnify:CR=1 FL=1
MGVINTTPDSFSDGGTLYRGARLDLDQAMVRAERMVADGAAVLDVGGESTRPGAAPVSTQEEMDRVVPLVAKISAELDAIVSVDTSTPEVMREAASQGALALVRDGDQIDIDIPGRSINVAISDEELSQRRAAMDALPAGEAWQPVGVRTRVVTRALKAYAAFATSADRGGYREI